MELSAKGRRVVVTGGSEGLGFATAKAYAQAGADVAIIARRSDNLAAAREAIIAGASQRVLAVQCDVSKASEVQRAFGEIDAAFGGVDVLVNNAGKSFFRQAVDITDDEWQADFDLKLFAAIRMTRLVWPGMKQRRWGRIINVLNTFAKAPAANTAPTSVTRAAGMALTKVLANEGAPDNILVNALLVGLIETQQTHRHHQTVAANTPYEQFVSEFGSTIPMGRLGRAEEFAGTALWLGSEAGGYITGTAINIDGGSCPVI